jgi:hypothetical protein
MQCGFDRLPPERQAREDVVVGLDEPVRCRDQVRDALLPGDPADESHDRLGRVDAEVGEHQRRTNAGAGWRAGLTGPNASEPTAPMAIHTETVSVVSCPIASRPTAPSCTHANDSAPASAISVAPSSRNRRATGSAATPSAGTTNDAATDASGPTR